METLTPKDTPRFLKTSRRLLQKVLEFLALAQSGLGALSLVTQLSLRCPQITLEVTHTPLARNLANRLGF
jgi:hypothetical protein